MSDTRKIVSHMFINLVKMPLDDKVSKQAAAVVDGLIDKLVAELPGISKSDWHKLRIAFCGMLAHGWALSGWGFDISVMIVALGEECQSGRVADAWLASERKPKARLKPGLRSGLRFAAATGS